jgi:hypothetical protein
MRCTDIQSDKPCGHDEEFDAACGLRPAAGPGGPPGRR